jgi:CBS domain containing-hemolysin-like protein
MFRLARRRAPSTVVPAPSEQERLITEGLAALRDATAREVMTPRVDVVALEAPVRLSDVSTAVRRSGKSHFPVFEGDLDHLLGVIFLKDLFPLLDAPGEVLSGDLDVTARRREPYLVPESRHALEILADMRRGRRGFALVVDEHGGLSGILTINDLVGELVGELRDEFDRPQSPSVRRIDSNRFLVDGALSLSEVREQVGVELPEGEYVTLAGFLLDAFGHIPEVGEILEREGWRFKVAEMDRRRIAGVIIERPPVTARSSTDDGAA